MVTRAANSSGSLQQRQQEELLQQLHLLEEVNIRVRITPKMVRGRRSYKTSRRKSSLISCAMVIRDPKRLTPTLIAVNFGQKTR